MKATLICAFFAAFLAASYVVGTPGIGGGGGSYYGSSYGGDGDGFGMDMSFGGDDDMMGGDFDYGMSSGFGGFTGGWKRKCICRRRCRRWERYAGECRWCGKSWCRLRCCPKW